MKQDKKQLIFLAVVSVMSFALAILGIIYAVRSESGIVSALLVACTVLLLALTVLYIIIIVVSMKKGDNFFLYDFESAKNVRPDELTAQMVNSRLDDFMMEYFDGPKKLLGGRGLIDGGFGVGAVLRPAVSYRLLYLAAESADVMLALESCDDRVLRVLCQALEAAGESDMPRVIIRHRESHGETEKLRRFLVGNQKYIQSRLMHFIKRNIEQFY